MIVLECNYVLVLTRQGYRLSTSVYVTGIPLGDFRLPRRCKLDLRSFAILRSVEWSRPLKIGPIGCPETSVRNYHSALGKIPKQRRSQGYRLYIYIHTHTHVIGVWFVDKPSVHVRVLVMMIEYMDTYIIIIIIIIIIVIM
jgi:hypothetical protein